MAITSNNQYLIVTPDAADDEGSYGDNTVYYVELAGNEPANWQIRPLVLTFNAGYRVSLQTLPKFYKMQNARRNCALQFITDVDDTLYFLTNLNAPRYKIVGIRIASPEPEAWSTLVEEDPANVLDWAAPINRLEYFSFSLFFWCCEAL